KDRIVFVEYDEHDRAIPNYRYDYGDALADGACRPVQFHFIGGSATFQVPDGQIEIVDFEDQVNDRGRSYRLRAALDLRDSDGGWVRHTLAYAIGELHRIRQVDRDAGGLVVAMDCAHAEQIAQLMEGLTG